MGKFLKEDELDRIRKVKIQTVLQLKEGRREHIRCPFHGDLNPSLVIYPEGTYFCFGCRASGKNSIDFLMELGYSFVEATQELEKYI